jgi:glycosyltransferase involved in cell wall biosynthesis
MVAETTAIQSDTSATSNWQGRVALIAKPGGPNTGVGRYMHMLEQGLVEAGIQATRVAPLAPPLPESAYRGLRRAGVDLRTFLMNYPVWADYPNADVYHLTSQNLATLLLFRRPPGRVIVTVHDIIPYMLRHNRQLSSYRTIADRIFDQLAMWGLHRANHLIADSHYTKGCVVKYLRIPPERISVVHLGIDHDRFKPLPVTDELYQRFRLHRDRRYLIYVGSEDPRKNLDTLLRALAEVRRSMPDLELIKVGRAHFVQQRTHLQTLASQLGIANAIHWLDEVSEDELSLLYNLADACVMPSLYEGFGFPVLEAMACGTPVVAANAASLPELVGNAGLLFEAGEGSVNLLAQSVSQVLEDSALRSSLSRQGLRQAQHFLWTDSVICTLQQYQDLPRPNNASQSKIKI